MGRVAWRRAPALRQAPCLTRHDSPPREDFKLVSTPRGFPTAYRFQKFQNGHGCPKRRKITCPNPRFPALVTETAGLFSLQRRLSLPAKPYILNATQVFECRK